MSDIARIMRINPYPGRLLLLARTADGQLAAGYALTGRSTESRARRLELITEDELAVLPVEESADDALRHYSAACLGEAWTVYGNGRQVSEVAARLRDGQHPDQALHGLEYEPDPPIYTPRITAVVDRIDGTAWFAAARRPQGGRRTADTTVTRLGSLAIGEGVALFTYESDGDEVRTAQHHVDLHTTAADAKALMDELWAALDRRFLVAATVFVPQIGVHGLRRHL